MLSSPHPVDRGKKEGVAVVGIAAVACAACCAGPIIGFVAALGIGAGLAVAVFGVGGLVVAVLGAMWLARRKRTAQRCAPDGSPHLGGARSSAVEPVMVDAPTLRTRR